MQSSYYLGDLPNYSIYVLNKKMGLAGTPYGETEQQIITQPKYDVIYPFVKGYAIVKKGEYYGLINNKGVETIPVIYKNIDPCWDKGYYTVRKEDGAYLKLYANNTPYITIETQLDVLKKQLWSKYYNNDDEFSLFILLETSNPNIFLFNKYEDDKVYTYNISLGKVIHIGSEFGRIINSDKLIVSDLNSSKKGIIDIYGNQIVPCIYDDLFYCSPGSNYVQNNLIEAKKGDKSGYIDFYGNVKIPFDYEYCGSFENGYAWVSKGRRKVGLIDKYGNIVEPLIHSDIHFLNNGRILFVDYNEYSSEGRYRVMGMPKDFVKSNWNYNYFSFDLFGNSDYVLVQTKNFKYGITDLSGQVIIPTIYDDILKTPIDKYVVAIKSGKYGLINMSNDTIVPFEYDRIVGISIPKNGREVTYLILNKNRKYGLFDVYRNECIPMMYDRLHYNKVFNCFIVEVGKEGAMVDIKNDIVVPFTSSYIKDF